MLKETFHKYLYEDLIQRGYKVLNNKVIGLPRYYGDLEFFEKVNEVIHKGIS
ncbi:MAG: hypothetical protein QMD43_03030 [Thermodesulfovibrio sp.]|jgi:hypothetical protein|uniref:hypothetical protein n=1 Tax=Thermodesulfovibrio sp. N1 TaxID=1871110 RepID=UPI000857B72A|nr:hypothetical protein [Thermodesulfovibrio sp. N1]MDI6713987.1 hypothetical protein [Thermodesulfovibrio sp.]ODA44997.1 hypothetical protein THER_0224 [Thermodesulfovibrio sp. N1]